MMKQIKSIMIRMKNAWMKYGQFFVNIATGIACGLLIIHLFRDVGSVKKEMILTILMMGVAMISLWIHTLLHEIGHLVFGWISGYRFSSFRIGSVMLVKRKGKLRLARRSIAGTVGQCLMIPPKKDDISFCLYFWGGVILNAFCSLICLIIALLLWQDSITSSVFMISSIIGFSVSLINGIPMMTDYIPNDGYQAIHIGRLPIYADVAGRQLRIEAALMNGMRLCEMPEQWFSLSDLAFSDPLVSTEVSMAVERMIDKGEWQAAKDMIDNAFDYPIKTAGLYRQLLICERIYCEAMTDCRKDIIESWYGKDLQKCFDAMPTFPTVMRARYVCAKLIAGDEKEVCRIAARFAKNEAETGEGKGERELFALLVDRLAQQPDKTVKDNSEETLIS